MPEIIETIHLSDFGHSLYHWESSEFSESYFGEVPVRFKLIYEGRLLATTSGKANVKHKHSIRKSVHRQLAELWKVQYPLPMLDRSKKTVDDAQTGEHREWTLRDEICDRHTKFGFRFAPLIERHNGLVCRLDIQFLRRSGPGEIVEHGGDLDNRIKTLLDALQVPKVLEDGEKPEEGENPFYCLLEDDALITEINVSADRLLTPVAVGIDPSSSTHPKHDILLIIGVETLIADPVQASGSVWLWS